VHLIDFARPTSRAMRAAQQLPSFRAVTVTEMLAGIDLVREQILVAGGLPLDLAAAGRPVHRCGHRVTDQRQGPRTWLRSRARPARRQQQEEANPDES
jgi:hypothetical protein